jgi:hypothetical protein
MPLPTSNTQTSPTLVAKRPRSNSINTGLIFQAANSGFTFQATNSQNQVVKFSDSTKGFASLAAKTTRLSQRKRILLTKCESPLAMTARNNEQKFISDQSLDYTEHSLQPTISIKIPTNLNFGPKKIKKSPFSKKSTAGTMNDTSIIMPGDSSEDYLDEFQESELVETFFFQPSLDSFSD